MVGVELWKARYVWKGVSERCAYFSATLAVLPGYLYFFRRAGLFPGRLALVLEGGPYYGPRHQAQGTAGPEWKLTTLKF